MLALTKEARAVVLVVWLSALRPSAQVLRTRIVGG